MDEFGRRPNPPPPVVTPEGEEEYEVKKILNSRKVGRQIHYLIVVNSTKTPELIPIFLNFFRNLYAPVFNHVTPAPILAELPH
jgi:hypothetical protein